MLLFVLSFIFASLSAEQKFFILFSNKSKLNFKSVLCISKDYCQDCSPVPLQFRVTACSSLLCVGMFNELFDQC